MRHGKKINHLGRTSAHRKAMLSNMATSLILHKRIATTLAKAKALRTYVEPLITRSKEDSTHSRRLVFSYLQSKDAVTELFREVSKKVADRPGGYTRILKTGNRLGDNADMCIVELVDYNETMLSGKETAKPKATRRRRPAKKATADGIEEAQPVAGEEKAVKKPRKPAKKEPEAESAPETPVAEGTEEPKE
jgi:large subunit ribosomal protein L17